MSWIQTSPATCSNTKKSGKSGFMLGLGVFLCALCCSIPLLVGIGIGGAVLTAIGAYAATLGALSLGLGVLGFVASVVWRRRARAASASCSVDCGCQSPAEAV